MTDYTQGTFFGFRDSLPSGDSKKKGIPELFDNEFDALVSESSSKIDKTVPSITDNIALVDSAGGIQDGGSVSEEIFIHLPEAELFSSGVAVSHASMNFGSWQSVQPGGTTLDTENIKKWRAKFIITTDAAASYTPDTTLGADYILLSTTDDSSDPDTNARDRGRHEYISSVAGQNELLMVEFDYWNVTEAKMTWKFSSNLVSGDVDGYNYSIYIIGYYP